MTGVQTCALPIYLTPSNMPPGPGRSRLPLRSPSPTLSTLSWGDSPLSPLPQQHSLSSLDAFIMEDLSPRSPPLTLVLLAQRIRSGKDPLLGTSFGPLTLKASLWALPQPLSPPLLLLLLGAVRAWQWTSLQGSETNRHGPLVSRQLKKALGMT